MSKTQIGPAIAGARLDDELISIAKSAKSEIEIPLSGEQAATQAVAIQVARLTTSLDTLSKKMQPKLWEVEVQFGNAGDALTPRLAVDLPVGLCFWQAHFSGSGNPTWAGEIHFYDQDGARLKFTDSLTAPAGGPHLLTTYGILFRKNLSVKVVNDAANGVPPYPLYVIMQGVSL